MHLHILCPPALQQRPLSRPMKWRSLGLIRCALSKPREVRKHRMMRHHQVRLGYIVSGLLEKLRQNIRHVFPAVRPAQIMHHLCSSDTEGLGTSVCTLGRAVIGCVKALKTGLGDGTRCSSCLHSQLHSNNVSPSRHM